MPMCELKSSGSIKRVGILLHIQAEPAVPGFSIELFQSHDAPSAHLQAVPQHRPAATIQHRTDSNADHERRPTSNGGPFQYLTVVVNSVVQVSVDFPSRIPPF